MKIAEKQSLRRQEIAATIRDVLSKSNFDNLTVDDICKVNGISKGTFYHYFSSKEQLLEEISCYPIDDFFNSQCDYFLNCPSFLEAIERYARAYALYISTSGPTTCRTVISSMGSNSNSRFISSDRPVNRTLWNIIVKHQKNDELRNDFTTQEMADMFLITCRGYILNCYSTNDFSEIEKKLTAHMKILAKGFLRE